MFEGHNAFEAEFDGGALKDGDRNRIIERVMQPAQSEPVPELMESPVWMSRRSWLSRGRNIMRCSPRPHGLGVAVDGDVAYGEHGHQVVALRHFIRPDLETFEGIRAERGCDGDVGSIAAACRLIRGRSAGRYFRASNICHRPPR